jgi:hypothetical protein
MPILTTKQHSAVTFSANNTSMVNKFKNHHLQELSEAQKLQQWSLGRAWSSYVAVKIQCSMLIVQWSWNPKSNVIHAEATCQEPEELAALLRLDYQVMASEGTDLVLAVVGCGLVSWGKFHNYL